MTEDRAVAVRQNGQLSQVNPEQTKALWAAMGGTNLTPEAVKALAIVGQAYSLDPALGEIMVLGGKPYIGVAGYLKIASRFPQYEGYELWPLTEAERKSMMVGPDEVAFGCKVYRKDKRFAFPGWGVASDRTVSMGSMKPYIREVAQKRALHRALRSAFPVGFPDEELDSDELWQAGGVPVALLDPADSPPKPPEPDWATWWIAVEGLGVSSEEAHRILSVDSVKEWSGSLQEAYERIEQHVAAAQQAQAEKERAGNIRKWSRQSLMDRYAERCDMADVLGIPHKPLDLTWTDEQIISEGEALKASCRAKQATIPTSGVQA